MAFTTGEMVIALTRKTEYFENLVELQKFAHHLEEEFGYEDLNAPQALEFLEMAYRDFEGDRVTAFYYELATFRMSQL
jgi:hypothetical protein